MRKRYAKNSIVLGILAFLYLVVFSVLVARADYTMALPDRYGILMQDVNKPAGTKYRFTCVPAAMANAIGYSLDLTVEETRQLYFTLSSQSKFKPTTPIEVWESWMDSVGIEKEFERYANIVPWGYQRGYHYIETIQGMLEAGYVVLVHFKTPKTSKFGWDGHVVTAYGYNIDDRGNSRLLYVDSDDNKYGVQGGVIRYKRGIAYLRYRDGKEFEISGYTAIRVLKPWGEK